MCFIYGGNVIIVFVIFFLFIFSANCTQFDPQERRLGGTHIDHGTFGFRASGTSLRVDLEDRESGFAERQEVPYRRIWASSRISIRRLFRIEKIIGDFKLGFELRACQRGFEDQGLLLRIDLDLAKRNNMSGKRNGSKTESSVVLRGKTLARSTESVIPRPFRYFLHLSLQIYDAL